MVLFVFILFILKVSLLICTLVFVLLDKLDKVYGNHLFLLSTTHSTIGVFCVYYVNIFMYMYSLLNWIVSFSRTGLYFVLPPTHHPPHSHFLPKYPKQLTETLSK